MNFTYLNHNFIPVGQLKGNELEYWATCTICNIDARRVVKNKSTCLFKSNTFLAIKNITCEEQQIKNLLE